MSNAGKSNLVIYVAVAIVLATALFIFADFMVGPPETVTQQPHFAALDADVSSARAQIGGNATVAVTLTNSGTELLTNVVITLLGDDSIEGVSSKKFVLAPEATSSLSLDCKVKPAAKAGSHNALLQYSADGIAPALQPVSLDILAPANITVGKGNATAAAGVPAAQISVSFPKESSGDITVRAIVKNTGNVTLHDFHLAIVGGDYVKAASSASVSIDSGATKNVEATSTVNATGARLVFIDFNSTELSFGRSNFTVTVS